MCIHQLVIAVNYNFTIMQLLYLPKHYSLTLINFHFYNTSFGIYERISAYVCGEIKDKKIIVQEKPFEMGETLKETSKLDITAEMNLLKKKIDELRSENANENTIKYVMKDYGIERYVTFLFCCIYSLINK